ncbi:MAG: DUF1127 domain-containing protein [Rhodobiaceae bacterium]|nr:DUF1127 domain-containing protein [Rhodobiaceae bacterium]MCC0056397.1 DUF1127 domain-containing protein [Rhodobiaceae bacterium]
MIQSDAYERDGRGRPDSHADIRRVLVDTGMAIIEPAMRLWRNWKRRDDLAILGELDEHLLDDIGLTAADVREALALPLADNASRMLAGRAHRSRQAWRLLGQR